MTQGENSELNTTAMEAPTNAEERAERYVGKREAQMINSAKAQKGALPGSDIRLKIYSPHSQIRPTKQHSNASRKSRRS